MRADFADIVVTCCAIEVCSAFGGANTIAEPKIGTLMLF
jgi:hypothetical protein